jgi:hypothetical protein
MPGGTTDVQNQSPPLFRFWSSQRSASLQDQFRPLVRPPRNLPAVKHPSTTEPIEVFIANPGALIPPLPRVDVHAMLLYNTHAQTHIHLRSISVFANRLMCVSESQAVQSNFLFRLCCNSASLNIANFLVSILSPYENANPIFGILPSPFPSTYRWSRYLIPWLKRHLR